MPLVLSPPTFADTAALLAFELENRVFFESYINARLASYYSEQGVTEAIGNALADAAHDRGYQYLLRDESGTLVARVNLSAVKRAHFHFASLGYRVAQSAAGKGYASEAVRQIVELAFGVLSLSRLEADARAENVGSVRVLTRNGFTQYGHSRRSFELAGTWYDRLHFELHAAGSRNQLIKQGSL